MEARIRGFKRGRHGIQPHSCIIELGPAALEQIVGERVFWMGPKGRIFKGRVLRRHGRDGYLCRFERALPADAVGSTVSIGRPMPAKAEKAVEAAKVKKEKPAPRKEAEPEKAKAAPKAKKEKPKKAAAAPKKPAKKKAPAKKK